MKRIYIFIIASAALLLSSCSIDSKKGFVYLDPDIKLMGA